MILFRTRPYGSAEWAEIAISAEDDETEERIADRISDSLNADDEHCQRLVDDEWEDL